MKIETLDNNGSEDVNISDMKHDKFQPFHLVVLTVFLSTAIMSKKFFLNVS